MKTEQIISTANNVSSNTANEVLLFQLAPKYSNETRKGCGLLGKEIDANFQYLNGNDIVDFRVQTIEEEDGNIKYNLVIQLRNGYEFPVSISDEFRPDTFEYDPEHGIFTVTRYDGEVVKLTGFMVEGRDVHVVNDGTIDGDGTWTHPLSVNPTLKTGVYSPVQEYVDLTDTVGYETLEDFLNDHPEYDKVKGLRFLTREKVNTFGYLYSLRGAKEVVETVGGGWRIPTLEDWDNMLNYIENSNGCSCDNPHQGRMIKELGCIAGKVLKSERLWQYDEDAFGTDDYGFAVLPVGSMLCNQERYDAISDFGKNAYFWTGTDFEGDGAWIKSFSFTTTTIRQEPDTGVRMYSLRLVKDSDWDGLDNEVIGGEIVPCASFPYMDEEGDRRSLVWTLINIAVPISHEKEYRYPDAWYEYSEETGYNNLQPGYFVCEWNGREWKKRQMLDGESVIILNTDSIDGEVDDKKEYTEYRVQWNEELEDFILVDVLDVFREEVHRILSELEGRVTLLEESAHTHENKEVLDSITEERVEAWDNAEENAKAFASAYTDEKIAEVGIVLSDHENRITGLEENVNKIVGEIGLDENLDVYFDKFKYKEVDPAEYPEAEWVSESTINENPSEEDPEFIMVGTYPAHYYKKEQITKYITDAETVTEALQNLDVALSKEVDDRKKAVEDAIAAAETLAESVLEESKQYTDEKTSDIENELNEEKENRRLGDERNYLKAGDRSVSVLHYEDGTQVKVNLPVINPNDPTPNHLWYDSNGLYFDGFYGVLPDEVIVNGKKTTIEYVGVTAEDVSNTIDLSGHEGMVVKAVKWTAVCRVADSEIMESSLEVSVQENVQNFAQEFVLSTFVISMEEGSAEGVASVTLISEFPSEVEVDVDTLQHEYVPNSLKFVRNGFNKITVTEGTTSHEYNVKTTSEMESDNKVRYCVKLHKDYIAYGLTMDDYDNASVADIVDNSARVKFILNPVDVKGFEEMSDEEQEAAMVENTYVLFLITNREIVDTIPNDIASDFEHWDEGASVNGVNFIFNASTDNNTIYDSDEGQTPGPAVELFYDIRF